MKPLFLITSAILVENEQERFLQTLHTIDSILCRIPNAEIWLCESSLKPLPEYMTYLLNHVKIIQFYDDKRIAEIVEEVNHLWMNGSNYKLGQIKNRTESYVINCVLNTIDETKYDRIFKISGRYFLTSRFSIEKHLDKGKISLKSKTNSKIPELTKIEHSRHCVMWSFCPTLLDEMKKTFANIEEYIVKASDNKIVADIEHGLVKLVDENIIREIDFTGAVGRVGSSESKIVHAD